MAIFTSTFWPNVYTDQKLSPAGQDNLLLLARQTKPELRDPPHQEPHWMVTALLLLVREPKDRKVNEVQKDHKDLQAQPEQPELLVLPALKVQQVLMAQMALTVQMEQQAHKDHKALRALKARKVIQDWRVLLVLLVLLVLQVQLQRLLLAQLRQELQVLLSRWQTAAHLLLQSSTFPFLVELQVLQVQMRLWLSVLQLNALGLLQQALSATTPLKIGLRATTVVPGSTYLPPTWMS
jgi:hypothetical protein